MGVGEASFCALAAPFIDDFAPPARKALWLAVFYLCIPLGVAGGFIYGGVVGGSPSLGWRWAFIIESLAMSPVVVFCLVSAPIPMRGITSSSAAVAAVGASGDGVEDATADEEEGGGGDGDGATASRRLLGSTTRGDATRSSSAAPAETIASSPTAVATAAAAAPSPAPASKAPSMFAEFVADFRVLLLHPVYVMTLLGYVAYTAVIGVYAVWGPKAGFAIYGDVLGSPENADMVLGLITVVAGVGGTVVGGLAVDKVGASIVNAVAVCSCSAAVGFVLLEASFAAQTFPAFAALFLFGETFAFAVQAPVNAVILWSVPPG